MQKYPASIRKVIHDLSNKAYDIELGQHLQALSVQFDLWKKGELDADSLHEQVHEYHKGPSRQIYAKYNKSEPDVLLAQAVAQGFIKEEEVPAEVMALIADGVQQFKKILA